MCVIDNDQCSPPGGRMRRKMCQVHYGRVADTETRISGSVSHMA